MNVNYLNDSDLDFLQHCSEEQLANFARLLTHNEKGKTRLSSVLMRNELFKSMEGHRATPPQLAADCRRITAFWWR